MKFQVGKYYQLIRTDYLDLVGMVVVCDSIGETGQVYGFVVYAPVNSTYAVGHFKIMHGGVDALLWANLVWVEMSDEESTLYRMS